MELPGKSHCPASAAAGKIAPLYPAPGAVPGEAPFREGRLTAVQVTVQQLAALVQGEVHGDGGRLIHAANC